jgi:hypothetical protein
MARASCHNLFCVSEMCDVKRKTLACLVPTLHVSLFTESEWTELTAS